MFIIHVHVYKHVGTSITVNDWNMTQRLHDGFFVAGTVSGYPVPKFITQFQIWVIGTRFLAVII